MKWITREHVKVDRVACPWLIRKFVDRDAEFIFAPADKVMDQALGWLSMLHFGRFGWFAETLWAFLGLALAVLSVSGIFLCCHRMIYKSSPKEIPR